MHDQRGSCAFPELVATLKLGENVHYQLRLKRVARLSLREPHDHATVRLSFFTDTVHAPLFGLTKPEVSAPTEYGAEQTTRGFRRAHVGIRRIPGQISTVPREARVRVFVYTSPLNAQRLTSIRRTHLDREPKVGNRHIDLLRLWKRVNDEGGYDKVSDTKGNKLAWRRLAAEFLPGSPNLTTQAFIVKSTYYKNLAYVLTTTIMTQALTACIVPTRYRPFTTANRRPRRYWRMFRRREATY